MKVWFHAFKPVCGAGREQGLDARFEAVKQALRPRFDGVDAGSARSSGRLDARLTQS